MCISCMLECYIFIMKASTCMRMHTRPRNCARTHTHTYTPTHKRTHTHTLLLALFHTVHLYTYSAPARLLMVCVSAPPPASPLSPSANPLISVLWGSTSPVCVCICVCVCVCVCVLRGAFTTNTHKQTHTQTHAHTHTHTREVKPSCNGILEILTSQLAILFAGW